MRSCSLLPETCSGEEQRAATLSTELCRRLDLEPQMLRAEFLNDLDHVHARCPCLARSLARRVARFRACSRYDRDVQEAVRGHRGLADEYAAAEASAICAESP